MSEALFLAGTVVFALAGSSHLMMILYDLRRPTFFKPTDESLISVLDATGVALSTKAPLARSMWRTWIGLNFSHALAPYTRAGAHARRTIAWHADAPTARSRNDYLSLSLTHRLSPKTNVFGGLSHTRFQQRDTTTSDAKSAFAGLYHRF